MSTQIDRSMMDAYRERWQMVAAVQAAERRNASIAQRWQKLNSLVRMAAALDLDWKKRDKSEEAVWERWNTIKTRYLAEADKAK